MSRPYNQILLEDIAIPKGIQTGPFGSQLKAEEYVDVGIPVVMPKDILGGFLSSETVARISETKARKLKKHKIISGDIIFPRRGDLRRIGVARDENNGWICGSGCLRARVKNDVFPGYLHQYLQLDSVGKWLERNALGQTMLNLNTEIISKMPITLPSLPEQKAIADLLSTWDEAIEKTERLIQAKEKRFQWLLRTLISEPQNTQNTRKGTAWKKVRLGEICSPVTRKNSENNTNVLTSSAETGLINQLEFYNKSVSADNVTGYYLLKKGEFAYNRSAAKGYPYGATKRLDRYDKGVLSTLYLCFALKPSSPCESDFLLHLFESGAVNRELRAVCQEGARSHGPEHHEI